MRLAAAFGFILFLLPFSLSADPLVDLFVEQIGEQLEEGGRAYRDYREERARWQREIAAARAELEACGGCQEAQARLDRWQGIENDFQEIAGNAAAMVGMPDVLADFLGIDKAMVGSAPDPALCEIRRPTWTDTLSSDCQGFVSAYNTCRQSQADRFGRCAWKQAIAPGAACYADWQLYDACRRDDAVRLRQLLDDQARRARGEIVPEILDEGWRTLVNYHRVPEDFLPPLPAPEAFFEALERGDGRTAQVLMNKGGSDALTLVIVGSHHSIGRPPDICNRAPPPDDIRLRRECDIWIEMRRLGERQVHLICGYGPSDPGGRAGAQNSVAFWFGERPRAASPEHILTLAEWHPLLDIGPPRGTCPVTLGEAQTIYAAAMREARDLANRRSPLALEAPYTRPQWILDRLEALYARPNLTEEERLARLEAYPLERVPGVYDLTHWLSGVPDSGDRLHCTLVGPGPAFSSLCTRTKYQERRLREPPLFRSVAHWRDDPEWGPVLTPTVADGSSFDVDLVSLPDADTGTPLVLLNDKGALTEVGDVYARMTRTDDLPSVDQNLVSGQYDLYFWQPPWSRPLRAACEINGPSGSERAVCRVRGANIFQNRETFFAGTITRTQHETVRIDWETPDELDFAEVEYVFVDALRTRGPRPPLVAFRTDAPPESVVTQQLLFVTPALGRIRLPEGTGTSPQTDTALALPEVQQAPDATLEPEASATRSVCPANGVGLENRLICWCPAQQANGFVFGTDVYTSDSAICTAALHAGAISREGGEVTVAPEGGQAEYTASNQNGIQSQGWGRFGASFRFVTAEAETRNAEQNSVAKTEAQAPDTPPACPTTMAAAPDSVQPLFCTCPPKVTSVKVV